MFSTQLSAQPAVLYSFASLPGKRREELERANPKEIVSVVVLPGLAEADKVEGAAWGSADREVAGHMTVVQVLVVLARATTAHDHWLPSFETSRAHDLGRGPPGPQPIDLIE